MKRVFMGVIALGLMVGAAVAQTAAPSTTVDLSPITTSLAGIVTVVLTGILGWLGIAIKNWVNSKIDLSKTQIDEQVQQTYNEAVARSMAYAESVIEGAVPKSVDVKNEFVATAAGYLIKMWPDLVKNLTADKIRDSIIARLPSGAMTKQADAIVVAKAGAATPTVVAK